MEANRRELACPTDLIGRIDADPEAREKGRSAKERREIETGLANAYAGEADALLEEADSWTGSHGRAIESRRDLASWPSPPRQAASCSGP